MYEIYNSAISNCNTNSLVQIFSLFLLLSGSVFCRLFHSGIYDKFLKGLRYIIYRYVYIFIYACRSCHLRSTCRVPSLRPLLFMHHFHQS